MKKVLLIVSIFMAIASVAAIKVQAQNSNLDEQTKFYRSIYNCQKGLYTPDSVEMFGHTISFEYRVLGMRNNKCYIRENTGGVIIDCMLPMAVAKKYAQAGLSLMRQSQQGAGYSQYITQIQNDSKYCKISRGN